MSKWVASCWKKTTQYSYFISGICSFFTCFSLPYALSLENKRTVTNSVLILILFTALIPFYRYVIVHLSKRKALCAGIAGLLFSACTIFGVQIYQQDHVPLRSEKMWLAVFGVAILFASIISCLFDKLPIVVEKVHHSKLERKFGSKFSGGWKYFVIVWLVLLLAWLPYLLASYPGVFRYDAPYQLNQMTVSHLTQHHPVIHTLYLAGSVLLGNKIFGSYEAGLAIYTITQMLLFTAICAYACRFLAKHKTPVLFQAVAVVYFACMPINPIHAVSATKDTLFAGFFLLLVLFTVDLVWKPERFFHSPFLMIRYALAMLLMCMWRNNGIYILAVFLPILLVSMRRYWKRLLVVCFGFVILFGIYSGPIMNLLDAYPGNKAEMLSVPVQQISRVVRDHKQELSQDELQMIYELIPEEYFSGYLPRISDPMKKHLNTDVFSGDPLKYVSLWVRLGLKYPGTYIDAFLSTTVGFWYADMIYPDSGTYHEYIEWYDRMDRYLQEDGRQEMVAVYRQSKFSTFDQLIKTYGIRASLQEIPVLSMVESTAAIFWLMVVVAVCCIYYKKYRMLLPMLILFGLWGTMLLGPVVLLRYTYPLMVCTPVLLAVLSKLPKADTNEGGAPCGA